MITRLQIARLLNSLRHDRSGATAIEYGLLVALITIGIISAIGGVGNQVSTTMQTANTSMSGANAAA